MVNSFDLKNKVVLVTGGYGYLGKAITKSLLFHNATVFVLGREEKKFLAAFSETKRDNLYFQFCDISKSESISNALKEISDKVNRIDILINNAFYTKGQSPINMTDYEWSMGIDGTVGSSFKFIREIIPYFQRNNSGKIINVSSMYGMVSPDFKIYDNFPEFLNPPNYGAAKAAIIQLTKYYATYLGNYGITVNCVTPGPFPSNEVQEKIEFIHELKERTCLNRIGLPEDIAGAFIFLASNASNFVTGQNLIVDGGWTTK
jgi:NAD(P)-dependent dehydrogenase (short-subunit alcohol dehydrogenase family)